MYFGTNHTLKSYSYSSPKHPLCRYLTYNIIVGMFSSLFLSVFTNEYFFQYSSDNYHINPLMLDIKSRRN